MGIQRIAETAPIIVFTVQARETDEHISGSYRFFLAEWLVFVV